MVNIRTPKPRPGPPTKRHGLAGLCSTLIVRRACCGKDGPRGHMAVHPAITLPCALGRTGVSRSKREGDAATPAGRMRILYGYFRGDRLARPRCRVPLRRLPAGLGWCDEPGSPLYNRPVPLPTTRGHEAMWRRDVLYDVVFALDYNMAPRRKGLGSAIFFHCAKPGFPPTLGCVALHPDDMRRLLPRLSRTVKVVVV